MKKFYARAFSGTALLFALCLGFSFTAKAEWINVELGPGGAQWVDDEGNIYDPGVDPNRETETKENVGPGMTGNSEEASEETSDEAGASAEEGAQETSGRTIDPSKPMIALTFDDGPYSPVGNRIMDTLAQYGGKATFYVVGNRCPSYASEMQRMVAEGHEIGNHTYEHKYLDTLGASAIQSQISQCNSAVANACGVTPTTVRLPGGRKNSTVMANISQPVVLWSIDTEDWKTRNAQSTINAVVGKVQDGDIVLMHELYTSTADAVDTIVPALVNAGYQLVTVSELAQYRGGMAGGQIYYSFRP